MNELWWSTVEYIRMPYYFAFKRFGRPEKEMRGETEKVDMGRKPTPPQQPFCSMVYHISFRFLSSIVRFATKFWHHKKTFRAVQAKKKNIYKYISIWNLRLRACIVEYTLLSRIPPMKYNYSLSPIPNTANLLSFSHLPFFSLSFSHASVAHYSVFTILYVFQFFFSILLLFIFINVCIPK